MVYLIHSSKLIQGKICIRTRIVMVYLILLYPVLLQCLGIRTRIVMVYHITGTNNRLRSICIRTRIVMVYLTVSCGIIGKSLTYSYKNCYGLSQLQTMLQDLKSGYSYKNCYGLSYTEDIREVARVRYSYKNCYGLSNNNQRTPANSRSIRTRIVMVYPYSYKKSTK